MVNDPLACTRCGGPIEAHQPGDRGKDICTCRGRYPCTCDKSWSTYGCHQVHGTLCPCDGYTIRLEALEVEYVHGACPCGRTIASLRDGMNRCDVIKPYAYLEEPDAHQD